jgi:hypothetical protein
LGRPLRKDEEVDLDELYSREFALSIGIEESNGARFNKVDAIKPIRVPGTSGTSGKAAVKMQEFAQPLFPELEQEAEPEAASDGTGDAGGLIRRFEAAKATLAWPPGAVYRFLKRKAGWTEEGIAGTPGPIDFVKLAPAVQQAVVDQLEEAAKNPAAYDTDGDIRFQAAPWG